MNPLYNSIKYLTLLLTILVFSCAKVPNVDTDINTGKFKSKLLLNINKSATRAANPEDDVRRLDIMLFKDGKLEKIIRNVTSFSISEDGYSSVDIGMDTEGIRKAYIVANLDNEIWLSSLTIGSTTIEELTTFQTANLTEMASPPFVMYGIISNIDFSTRPNSTLCHLHRVVARIDVDNKASNFTLTSARLINSKVASTIFPNGIISNSEVRNFGVELANDSTHIRLYSYENDMADVNQATKVEITGMFNGVTLTYKVDLAQDGNPIPIERNFVYTVNINDIDQNEINAAVSIRPWKLGDDINEVVSGSCPLVDITIEAEVGVYSKLDSILYITDNGGQIIFDAQANAECAIDINGDWIMLAAQSKAGSVIDGRFIVNIPENTTKLERSATIRIYNKINNTANEFTIIQSGDVVLSFKVDGQSYTNHSTDDKIAINYLYAFIAYTAADGTTDKFEKIADGENLTTISHTLPAGSYLKNSSAILYVLANTSRTLGNITQSELESALESKETCVIGNDGTIVIEKGLVCTRKINLTLQSGMVTSQGDSEGVNNGIIALKRLSGRVYVTSTTGKQEDIAGYRVKLEKISSSATYFTYEGSDSSEFGEYVTTGNVDGQYSVNGKETESIGYFYPSANVKVTVSHPSIPGRNISQYIKIESNTNSTITINPYSYNLSYPKELIDAGMEIYTVFNSGTEANSVRIPCLVTAKDGSLLTFCETRYNTWKDQSYTDIAVKRSTDNGRTWSSTINITGSINGGPYAFMDPTAVVDAKYSGRVFMFCVRRTVGFGADITRNVTYMFTSEDNGVTWDKGKVVDKDIVGAGLYSAGPGPASGIQLKKGAYAGRMIFPMRQSNNGSLGAAIYSDDGGITWGILSSSLNAGESQIAEVEEGHLYLNVRRGTERCFSRSTNSGATWNGRHLDLNLPVFESGCQASVLGNADNVLLYCGPKGGVKTTTHDNRFELTLYRSFNGGVSWENTQLLYNLASGYSDMTILDDGRLAIVFECGPEKGFAYLTSRPAGWVQLQMLILPKEVLSRDYWFDHN